MPLVPGSLRFLYGTPGSQGRRDPGGSTCRLAVEVLGAVASEVMVEIVDAGGPSASLKGRVSDRHTRQGASLHLLRLHPWSAETVSAPGPTRSAPVGGLLLRFLASRRQRSGAHRRTPASLAAPCSPYSSTEPRPPSDSGNTSHGHFPAPAVAHRFGVLHRRCRRAPVDPGGRWSSPAPRQICAGVSAGTFGDVVSMTIPSPYGPRACCARPAVHRLGVRACGQRTGRGLCRRRRSRMSRQGAPGVRRYLLGGGTRQAGDLRGSGPYGREGP